MYKAIFKKTIVDGDEITAKQQIVLSHEEIIPFVPVQGMHILWDKSQRPEIIKTTLWDVIENQFACFMETEYSSKGTDFNGQEINDYDALIKRSKETGWS